MPKLSGVFDQFSSLDKISSEDVNRWLKVRVEVHTLENFIANRIYFPQTVPMTQKDMEIDLAILKEAIKLEGKKYYSVSNKRIVIPEDFAFRFFPVHKLVSAFIDGIENLKEIVQIYIQQKGIRKLVGSVYVPTKLPNKDQVTVSVDNQKFNFKINTLTLIPIEGANLKISLDSSQESVISGGEIGVFIDLRKREWI